MATEAGWGAMDPNSANQLWSRWTFTVRSTKYIPLREVQENVTRWLRQGFGSIGRARVTERRGPSVSNTWTIECEVEGVAAHDPGFVESVRLQFLGFVEKGWGMLATGETEVRILAGDVEDGRPRDQLLVMPSIPIPEMEDG